MHLVSILYCACTNCGPTTRTRDPLSGQLQAELDLRQVQTLSNLQLDVPQLANMSIEYTVPLFLYICVRRSRWTVGRRRSNSDCTTPAGTSSPRSSKRPLLDLSAIHTLLPDSGFDSCDRTCCPSRERVRVKEQEQEQEQL